VLIPHERHWTILAPASLREGPASDLSQADSVHGARIAKDEKPVVASERTEVHDYTGLLWTVSRQTPDPRHVS